MNLLGSETVIGDRYVLLEIIGSGSMGSVFRARDRLNDAIVALKRVSIDYDPLITDGAQHYASRRLSLANEFRALATLRHPNIISVLDYGFDREGQPYFTMDWLDQARDVRSIHTESLGEKVHVLIQILQALAYLHQRGVIHRDLKPSNVLLDRSGQIKVLDFGLALTDVHSTASIRDVVAGTLRYVAPEVLNGEPHSPAMDLYAVGVIAYELFAGRHPFDIRTTTTLLVEVLQKPADVWSLGLPDDLAVIVGRLLAKTPDERYPDAQTVIQHLSSAVRQPMPAENVTIRESYLQTARFVGREAELQTLLGALEQATQGQGSAWLIGGESGVGKSRLIEELRIHGLVNGMLVLRGQGVPEGGLPYHLWRDPLRRLVLSAPLSPLEAGVLKELVPDIEHLLARPVPDAPELSGLNHQQRLTTTIVEILRRHPQPIMLLLEDLQWITESLEPLKVLQSLVKDLRVLIVGTYRFEERADLPSALPEMQLIRLERFSPSTVAALSASILGKAGGKKSVVEFLVRQTEGNAFFILEVVRVLAETYGRLSDIPQKQLPSAVTAGGIHDILQRRLARVPVHAMPLLKLAAALGRQVDWRVMSRLARAGNLERWLMDCTNVAVLEIVDGAWRFSHDKIRDAILETLTEAERPTLHRQVAEAIEAVYPDQTEYALQLVDHWHRAGDDPKEAAWSVIAGRQRMQVSAYTEAVTLFWGALGLMPLDSPQRIPLLTNLGEALWHLGNYRSAMEQLRTALTLADGQQNASSKADIYFWLSQIASAQGEYQSARDYLQTALADAPPDNAAVLTRIYYGLGDVAWRLVEIDEATRHILKSLELARAIGDQTQILFALNRLGSIAFFQNDLSRAEQFHVENHATAARVGNRERAVSALNNLGEIARLRQQFDLARQRYEEALAISVEIAHPQLVMLVTANLGRLALDQKKPADARPHFIKVLQMAWAQESTIELLVVLAGLAEVRALEGYSVQAAEWLGVALNHPAADVNIRSDTKPIYDHLAAELGEAEFKRALERGAKLDLKYVVRELLFGSSTKPLQQAG